MAVAASIDATQPDVTLRLNSDGVIREASLSRAFSAERTEDWLGRRWTETVDDFGEDKVRRILEDACARGVSGFRHVMQRFPSGLELPMEYTAVRLGGDAGLVAIGKNLRAVSDIESRLMAAQLAMERDSWKLRHVESRYRALFDASNDAVLLVRAADLRIVEANPAAVDALGIVSADREFLAELPVAEREPFRVMLASVQANGRAPAAVAHLGASREAWIVRASLMPSEPAEILLLQLSRAGQAQPLSPSQPKEELEALIERTPDGIVIVDDEGSVVRANQAFLDLAQLASEAAVVGERLRRWMSQPGADAAILLASVRRNGPIRLFPTILVGELGIETAVEVSAVAVGVGPNRFGLVVRDTGQRIQPLVSESAVTDKLGTMASKIGEITLQDLVRDATGLLEKHCIDAALNMTGNNRTAAAQLLGLSRQSLYVKLNRYGNGGGDDSAGSSHNG